MVTVTYYWSYPQFLGPASETQEILPNNVFKFLAII